MFVIDTNSKSSLLASKVSSTSSSNVTPLVSFSDLLKASRSDKDIKDNALILSLSSDKSDKKIEDKNSSLLSLLHGENLPKDNQVSNFVDLKSLIDTAKKSLKSKILSSGEYKKSQIKKLPKSLKGLISLAKTFHIDISKIKLEDLNVSNKVQVKEKPTVSTKLTSKELVLQHTTEELVQNKPKQKIQKDKVDKGLKLLLSKHKNEDSNVKLTSDFSVASAKVIAPKLFSSLTKHQDVKLETLLHSSNKKIKTEDIDTKTDTINIQKHDNLGVKIHEAKQMVKYLSSDVKNAINDYKSPFTRLKIQLNPQKLGKLDVTIVQRGKDLHVNLSSNNVAINTLALNANDLKVQLNNNGINNATLNFNNNSQSDNTSAGQQQQRQNQQHANKEYKHFEKEEKNEEIINSLEIIVPHYV